MRGVWYLQTCRDCGTTYWLKLKPSGSKWTSLCSSCIYWET
jgi:hypothetical protein